jgi:hypothetical protein
VSIRAISDGQTLVWGDRREYQVHLSPAPADPRFGRMVSITVSTEGGRQRSLEPVVTQNDEAAIYDATMDAIGDLRAFLNVEARDDEDFARQRADEQRDYHRGILGRGAYELYRG